MLIEANCRVSTLCWWHRDIEYLIRRKFSHVLRISGYNLDIWIYLGYLDIPWIYAHATIILVVLPNVRTVVCTVAAPQYAAVPVHLISMEMKVFDLIQYHYQPSKPIRIREAAPMQCRLISDAFQVSSYYFQKQHCKQICSTVTRCNTVQTKLFTRMPVLQPRRIMSSLPFSACQTLRPISPTKRSDCDRARASRCWLGK